MFRKPLIIVEYVVITFCSLTNQFTAFHRLFLCILTTVKGVGGKITFWRQIEPVCGSISEFLELNYFKRAIEI